MKKHILSGLLLCVMCLPGCAFLRESAIGISEEEVLNAETTRTVARNYLSIWPIQSGFLRANLGHRREELPKTITDAWDELDKLADSYAADPNSFSDYELGASLGYRSRTIIEAIMLYIPDAVKFLPFLL